MLSIKDFEKFIESIQRFPKKYKKEEFYPIAYQLMYLSRRLDERLKELFKKGYVKGTVILSKGNEATCSGAALPFRPGYDVLSLLHRDLPAHIAQGVSPLTLLCQYLANEKSPTHGREGNVHHGNASMRRFPMISHLGNMLAVTVGGVLGARRKGEEVLGLAVIGDGGSSTGDFHEAINIASVHRIPVLFLIENNYYAYSTPIRLQYNCNKLSDRAIGYGIEGKTIDGTDVWEVYSNVYDYLLAMSKDPSPKIIECMTLRLEGHAAYDKAEYVPEEERKEWLKREPIMKCRKELMDVCKLDENSISQLEKEIEELIDSNINEAITYKRPSPSTHLGPVYASLKKMPSLPPFTLEKARNINAVNAALDYILANFPDAVIFGQDVGVYGSAFKTCKGLYEKYGAQRVMDMPISESATVGLCIGASQTGLLPIMEFQFADFSTEATTQLGLNAGSWFFRSGSPAQILFRLPCGAGISLGAFHSGEYEGIWSRFPGLKIFYPVTPQETFEALIAGFIDPNPCIVFEHKLLYGSSRVENINFNGDCSSIIRPRKYCEGSEVTIVAFGAMVESVLSFIKNSSISAEVWNPFILKPLMIDEIIESVKRTGKLLVVQESNETAGLGDRIISLICRKAFNFLKKAPRLLAAPDIPVPFAKELESYYIPDVNKIKSEIEFLLKGE